MGTIVGGGGYAQYSYDDPADPDERIESRLMGGEVSGRSSTVTRLGPTHPLTAPDDEAVVVTAAGRGGIP